MNSLTNDFVFIVIASDRSSTRTSLSKVKFKILQKSYKNEVNNCREGRVDLTIEATVSRGSNTAGSSLHLLSPLPLCCPKSSFSPWGSIGNHRELWPSNLTPKEERECFFHRLSCNNPQEGLLV